MSENLNHKKQFILEDKDGTRWLFLLSSNNRILYSQLKKDEKFQNNMVDSQPVKDFYATIDENGTVMILAYTLSRQLIYYEWYNKRWERQVLERIYSRFQNISYASILAASNSIHILYYIESSLTRSAESLVHYYLQDGKWYGGRLWKFVSDESVTPRAAFLDPKDNLHIIFTKLKKYESLNIFHARFHSSSLSWTGPSLIHTSTGQCDQFQLCIDDDENIYLVWREKIDGIYYLNHLHQIKKDPVLSWNQAILYQSTREVSSPTIVHGDELLCLWKEDNVLYRIKSLDLGRSWSRPHPLAASSKEQFSLFHYINCNRNQSPSHSIHLWGQGYPDTKLAGIDWLPSQAANTPEQTLQVNYSNQWAEVKETVSLINKETKHIRTQIANLSAQVDQLYSAIYELQEQFKIKEKSIFAIQTEVKRLESAIRKMKKNTASAPNKAEVAKVAETAKAANPVESDTYKQSGAPTIESSYIDENNKEPEKITLGNTTILINPEDSDL